MASTTSNLGLTKPAYTDDADIGDMNGNFDLIDAEAGRVRANFAGTYSTSSAYAVGTFVIYQGDLYRCNTAIGSGGEAWNSSHWNSVSVGSELSTKLSSSDIANNVTTTESGKVLDARQGKALSDSISTKVTGPSNVTSDTIPLYDGTTGKAIKAGKTITDVTSSTAIPNNANMPTNRTVYNAIYNGLNKTAEGFALDARQGKALNDKITGFVIEEKTCGNTYCNANAMGDIPELSISKSGYTPIAVWGTTSQYSNVVFFGLKINGNKLTGTMMNLNGSSVTAVPKVQVLYAKN